jgi:uncharacterized membrane protein YccC
VEELLKFFGQVSNLVGLGAVVAAIVLLRWKVPQVKSEAALRSLEDHRKMLVDADKVAAQQRDEIKRLETRLRHLEEREALRREEDIQRDAALIAYRRHCRMLEGCWREIGRELPAKDPLLVHIEERL